MNIEKSYITPSIILLTFENQLAITSTLLRFQEHYESPEFSGKIFTLDEFKEWYIKQKGKFSYYSDWNGFNFPSTVLKPFLDGSFNPLSDDETHILSLLENEKDPFYVIGVHKSGRSGLLTHEIAHALFFTNADYKKQVLAELKKYDLSKLESWLRKSGGYCDAVIEDELHAYSLSSNKKLLVPKELRVSLKQIYDFFM